MEQKVISKMEMIGRFVILTMALYILVQELEALLQILIQLMHLGLGLDIIQILRI